ncbi:MAG: DUF5706 domain-containing protein [Sphingomonas bacterium]|nr:DUF5706 domain-containing protein [Sphingomonas bacterium]
MDDKQLKPGNPDHVFPKEVHNLLVLANTTNITLSQMADTKASILMGASFVVFSMSIGDIGEGKASLPLLVLTIFSFIATILGVLTVRPNRMRKLSLPADQANLLFFGSYVNAPREAYVDEVIKVLSSEEETYRRLARDLWDHGQVLRDDKFRWLYWSFTLFLVGMLVTAVAVIVSLVR